MSAWASENELSLGQVQVDKKSNEIKAIPRLLDLLVVKDCIVTLDAMGCQKAISKKIRSKEGDYVFTLKGNQGNLHERVRNFFNNHQESSFRNLDHEFHMTEEKSHGRHETRSYYLVNDLAFLKPHKGWQDLNGVGMVISERTVNGKTSSQTRYFITSLGTRSISDFARAVRCHWGIENKVHWILDVCFREDQCRVRKNYAAQNFAMLRKIVLNLIKQDKKTKASFKARKLLATWSENYALEVLIGKKLNDSN